MHLRPHLDCPPARAADHHSVSARSARSTSGRRRARQESRSPASALRRDERGGILGRRPALPDRMHSCPSMGSGRRALARAWLAGPAAPAAAPREVERAGGGRPRRPGCPKTRTRWRLVRARETRSRGWCRGPNVSPLRYAEPVPIVACSSSARPLPAWLSDRAPARSTWLRLPGSRRGTRSGLGLTPPMDHCPRVSLGATRRAWDGLGVIAITIRQSSREPRMKREADPMPGVAGARAERILGVV